MRSPDGRDYCSTGTYKDISPMNHITYTDTFSDIKGKIVPPKFYDMKGDVPIEFNVNVRFIEVKGGTKMVVKHSGMDAEMRKMARIGWMQSFDKLAQL